MRPGILAGFGSVLGWFAFPLVPALLGSTFHRTWNNWFWGGNGPDPRDWDGLRWVILTGPLLGYGFLAGATLNLPDEPAIRGPKGWISRRSAWVAIGPWVGFVAGSVLYLAILFVTWAYPPSRSWPMPSPPPNWQSTWAAWLLARILFFLVVGSLAYGWLFVAWAALRRARRLDRLGRAFVSGLAVAMGFVGSLLGSFWAITEAWRGYFFDSRIVPILIVASNLALMIGCAGPQTYGEVRRRELFEAMLMAWLLGLALAWRWWSRSRSKPSGRP